MKKNEKDNFAKAENSEDFIKKDFSKVIDNIKNTIIKKSEVHGYGLFATKLIKEGQVLCILDGQYLNYSFVKKTIKTLEKESSSKEKLRTLEWNQITNNLLLVRPYATKYRFINHSRIPNVRVLQNPIRVISIKNIYEGEELLLDYREEELGDEYLLDHGMSYL